MSQRRRKFRPGSVIAGTNYRVLRFLGSGAMGAVYEVVHGRLDKPFVIKVLHHDLADHDDPVRRLCVECRLLGRLQHPNIVTVTDAGMTHDGLPYFVMERLQGETLYSRMCREPRWAVPDVIRLAIQVLDGLVAAHHMGIIHRDIKPSNIFLSQDAGIKLLDFGIAKMFGTSATVTAKGVTLGTPRYMSPEQASGNVAGFRSDLYALGIIVYELIVGSHPFQNAQTPAEMLIAQATWEAPLLPTDIAGRAKDLGPLVAKLLAKNPATRPASAAAVRECMQRIAWQLANAPITRERSNRVRPAKRAKSPQRAGRQRSLSRWGMTLAAIAVAASILAVFTPIRRIFSDVKQPAAGSFAGPRTDAQLRQAEQPGTVVGSNLPRAVTSVTPEPSVNENAALARLPEVTTEIRPVTDKRIMGNPADGRSQPRGPLHGATSSPVVSSAAPGSAEADFVNLTRR